MNARHILPAAAIGLGLALSGGVASAQYETAPVLATNSTGTCYTTGTPGNWTISCGDINYAPGRAVVVAPTVDTADAAGVSGTTTRTPATISNEPLPEPASTSTETLATDTPANTTSPTGTVATETDRDADNYADALEVEVGLDPTNPDTDNDGVADGDEFALYSTDPNYWDSDGDSFSDGEELFGILTDPLVWNAEDGTASVPASEASASSAAPANSTSTTTATDDATPPTVIALDSDFDSVADVDERDIYGTDPFVADSDGDGLTDGNELFGTITDPLLWDSDSDGIGDGQIVSAKTTDTLS